ncbi:MAG: family 10 glycosylhydrolase [Prochlorotrichaceae cyanobacterium]
MLKVLQTIGSKWQYRSLAAGFQACLLAGVLGSVASPSLAQTDTTLDLDRFCRLSPSDVERKDRLREAASTSVNAAQAYQAFLQAHSQRIRTCRQQNWPQQQAIWLRLYPCDVNPDRLSQVLDQVVNAGYNQVFVEVFYDGRVLLPSAENTTPWPSVINEPGYETVDLLEQSIDLGRARGLQVYAWLFTLNFGYSYSHRSDRTEVLARNGRNLTSLDLLQGEVQAFIDPYNPIAQTDYTQLLELVRERRPDGILFDYVRYPRGTGAASVAGQVQDLMIYGAAAQTALINRAQNNKGRSLIQQFVQKGFITVNDIDQVNKRYPQEGEPLWQGRQVPPPPKPNAAPIPLEQQQARIQQELWLLSVAHAQRGVLDFLQMGVNLAQQANIPSGAVFFPGGNQTVGQSGYDARLQPWDQFSPSITWHPMVYAACGRTDCILDEIRRVVNQAKPGTLIQPALAGMWGQSSAERPSLDQQMAAIQRSFPTLQAVSHFAYSWQYPQSDQERKFCRLP